MIEGCPTCQVKPAALDELVRLLDNYHRAAHARFSQLAWPAYVHTATGVALASGHTYNYVHSMASAARAERAQR